MGQSDPLATTDLVDKKISIQTKRWDSNGELKPKNQSAVRVQL